MEHTYIITVRARGAEALCDRQIDAVVARLERTEPGFVATTQVTSCSRLNRGFALAAGKMLKLASTAERVARYDGS